MISLLLAVPFVFNVTPSSATAGAPGTSVVIEGRGFTPDAIVRWNGHDRQTVFVSNGELRARLRPSDLIAAEPGFISVYDRASHVVSAAARFEITAPQFDPAQARLFLLAPPMEPNAPAATPAIYEPQRAAKAHPVEPPRVPGKSQL